ncbi:hypothetical protein DESC_640023 [Desulfosarcina cetonica]|nr:hypothetical protein DESC_640023 [Desulfosarcina cetonica]
MFHLQPGVHLQKIELPVVVKDEFHGTGVDIAGLTRQAAGHFAHSCPGFGIQGHGRGLLDDFLVTALDRAFALAQVNGVAMGIGHHLDFDMARGRDIAFDEDGVIAKGLEGFLLADLQGRCQVLGALHRAHALAASTGRRFEQDRIAHLGGHGLRLRITRKGLDVAGYGGNAGLDGQLLGCDLVAQAGDHRTGGADEGDAGGGHSVGESRVLGEKTIARMNGLAARILGDLENFFFVEIRFRRPGPAQRHGLVGLGHMQAAEIGIRIDRHGADAQALAGLHHTDGDFATIGNQDFFKHGETSQGNVAVFTFGPVAFFALQELKRADEPVPGVAGKDHIVDIAAFGRQERIDVMFAVMLHFLVQQAVRIGSGGNFLAVDHLRRPPRSQNGDFRGGPGVVDVTVDVLGVHHQVGAAIGLAHDHGDARYAGLGKGVEQFGAMTDNAAMFLIRPGHEAGHVHQADQRDVEGIAKAHETRGLEGGMVVQHPGQHGRLIGHQADGLPPQASEPADDVAGEIGLHRQKLGAVEDAGDQHVHVVALVGVRRYEVVQGGIGALGRIVQVEKGGLLPVVGRQVVDQLANAAQAENVIGVDEMGHAAFFRVDTGPAQVFGADIRMDDGFNHVGAGDEHIGGAVHHEDEIGDRRAVHRAAGAGPHDAGDLGDNAAGVDVAVENFAIGRQGVHPLLDTGAA